MSKDQIGTTEVKDNKATIMFTRVFKQSPSDVWNAITDPEQFGVWYNATAQIDPRVGGQFTVASGPFNWYGPITVWQPNEVFEYEHNHDPVTEMPNGAHTIVRWELTPQDGGTLLKFTQSGLDSTAGFAPGTHVVLDRLVAHANGETMPDFGEYYNEVEPSYEAWSADVQQ